MKSAIIVGVFFVLTSSAWAGTFIEAFNDGDLENWRELKTEDAVHCSWEVINGELHAINRSGAACFFVTGDETWQNYTIAFDVKPLEKLGPGTIGIVARVEEAAVFWCRITDLILNDPESKVMCSSFEIGEKVGHVFHMDAHPFLRANKWSRLKLSVDEDHFSFWINGKKIVEPGMGFIVKQDDQAIRLKTQNLLLHPTGTGSTGLAFSNYIARFNNITVAGEGILDKDGLSVSPRGKLAATWGSLKKSY